MSPIWLDLIPFQNCCYLRWIISRVDFIGFYFLKTWDLGFIGTNCGLANSASLSVSPSVSGRGRDWS